MKKAEISLSTLLKVMAFVAAFAAVVIAVVSYWRPICDFFRKVFAGVDVIKEKFSCPCLCKAAKKPSYTEEELFDFADVEV